ncbi:hypothetical protein EA462_08515 [Natrarchaeobius halalkaliphilus]|uniref:Uncharacterized protein n=2 Tax=Natrarchaeobius halalkaliphilus TaxID=1679091 RepID=A0A3N6P4M7_9EURY|nr:hypothetical protein EA462_08515 [Natrarchaeobius halalkaliphilus]
MDDIEYVREENVIHLWSAIISAAVSVVIPIVGILAAYSGYRLTTMMTRRWFGLLFAAFGLTSLASWLLWLLGVF